MSHFTNQSFTPSVAFHYLSDFQTIAQSQHPSPLPLPRWLFLSEAGNCIYSAPARPRDKLKQQQKKILNPVHFRLKYWKGLCLSKRGQQFKCFRTEPKKCTQQTPFLVWLCTTRNKMYLHKPCPNDARNPLGFSLGDEAANVAVSNSWQPDVKCLFYIC